MKNMQPRHHARWKIRNGLADQPRDPLSPRVISRAHAPDDSGLRVRYDRLVAVGTVDREEWAKVVQELLDAHTRGKKEPFARLIGVNPRTVHSWLRSETAVTEQSIRQVAQACGVNSIDLLIRVGFYAIDEMPRVTHEQMNAERRRVLDSGLPDDVQAEILMELDRMEREDAEMLKQLEERDRQRREARVNELLAQRRTA